LLRIKGEAEGGGSRAREKGSQSKIVMEKKEDEIRSASVD